jgi:hypothetical protein
MAACFVKPGKWQNSPLRSAYLLEGSSAESLGLGVSQEAMQGALVTLISDIRYRCIQVLSPG